MSSDHQRIKWRRNIAENFNRLSRVHERYRQTTDRKTDDRRHIAKMNMSSSSLKISYRRDDARRRSLSRSRSFKLTNSDISRTRKPVCNLKVNNTKVHGWLEFAGLENDRLKNYGLHQYSLTLRCLEYNYHANGLSITINWVTVCQRWCFSSVVT